MASAVPSGQLLSSRGNAEFDGSGAKSRRTENDERSEPCVTGTANGTQNRCFTGWRFEDF